MQDDTAAWRQFMLLEYELTDANIAAWFRGGFTPTQIEECMQNIARKEIGGRHFERKDDTLMVNSDSALFVVETYNQIASDDAAVVQLRVVLDNKTFVVSGSSKRAPGDKPDQELGLTMALARALEGLVTRLGRQVNGRVKQNDWIAEQRPLVAKARAARSATAALQRAENQAQKEHDALDALEGTDPLLPELRTDPHIDVSTPFRMPPTTLRDRTSK